MGGCNGLQHEETSEWASEQMKVAIEESSELLDEQAAAMVNSMIKQVSELLNSYG
jgi:hypothetical protein